MLENGKGQEFCGKDLDEININVDALVSDVEDYSVSGLFKKILNKKLTIYIFSRDEPRYPEV